MACWTILKKEMCLGISNACGFDPVVALYLRNGADYRLPTFWPHGTKLGHSWFQWKMKSGFPAGWQFWIRRRVWAVRALAGVIPRLHSTSGTLQTTAYHFFTPHGSKLGHSWSQIKMKRYFLAGLTILKKETRLGIVSACGGIPRFHSTSGTLPTTANLLLDHMAPN